ncbi:sterile alpha motif domain-containing protein 12-like isoform X3 [Anguilla rostrata]|uniref:sterile alpha motif domain-containing protein 12-like isoform X3 n=1 Tax=Anguilla rostrata TaxID=7938 RepID=UPI0030CF6415
MFSCFFSPTKHCAPFGSRGSAMNDLAFKSTGTGMGSCKRVSNWTVEEVHVWATAQYPSSQATFRQAVSSHAISGRALLRMSEHQLERMGVGAKQQREILRDILLLRVREELENLNDIFVECFSS